MPVIGMTDEVVSVYADGRSFGTTGPYEVVRARAVVAVDPSTDANASLADIDRAQRSGDGRVTVVSDVLHLRPVEPELGNGCLLSVVPNRGGTGGVPFALGSRTALGEGLALEPGDGWPLRAGWSIAWVGWQWDVEEGLLGCRVPSVIDAEGAPLAGTVRVELQPLFAPVSDIALRSAASFSTQVPYPAADVRQVDAELRWSPGRGRRQQLVPREDWRFARLQGDEVVEDATRLWVAGGLLPDRVYELLYRTAACPFVAGGLAAYREVSSHLRRRAGIDHAVAVGWSQSGRFLRELLRSGLNVDDEGRPVFDAVMPFIAGASRGEFNQRHGQPAEALAAGVGHLPPFSLEGLLGRQRKRGAVPKVVLVNSASEYWRADGSLGHIAENGQADLPLPEGTRSYLLAGTDHVGGAGVGLALPGGVGNTIVVTPLHRALLELTRRWIVDGTEPPPSQIPRVDDGTAVERSEVLARFERVGLPELPTVDQLAARRHLDLGPGADEGVAAYPARRGSEYAVSVSTVDADGNEVAGIRHPEIAVPLATHAGWTPLLAQGPSWEAIGVLLGTSHPFARTSGARDPGDDRPALADRYASAEDYADRVRVAALALVDDEFLLADDVDLIVDRATDSYRELTADPTGD